MMAVQIQSPEEADLPYDTYVYTHSHSDLYHLSGWLNIIQKTYGHKGYLLTAQTEDGRIAGALTIVLIKNFFFGKSLVSLPFFDFGGILANHEEAEEALIQEAIALSKRLGVEAIELRHTQPLSVTPKKINGDIVRWSTRTHKVRMMLKLPDSSDALLASFKSKLRSQIKKPVKSGLHAVVGGTELLDDFYKVFSINMRDLGSPVHSHAMIENVLKEFPGKAKLILVYKDNNPLACSMIVGYKNVLENPWASALREYSRLSPNMLLYWTMLEYACNNRYEYFDFGRSSPDEGTYKFKKQWGAESFPLYWQSICLGGNDCHQNGRSDKSNYGRAIQIWQRLPVPVTRLIGPRIRKYISL